MPKRDERVELKLSSDELQKFDAVAERLGTDRSNAVRVVMLEKYRELVETRPSAAEGPANTKTK